MAFVVSMPRTEPEAKPLLLAVTRLPTLAAVQPVPPTLSASMAPLLTVSVDELLL